MWYILDDCAAARRSAGDPLGAVARYETARDLAEQHLWDRHPNTLTARANLANSYRSAGWTGAAITLQERVLVDSVDILWELRPAVENLRTTLAAG